MPSYFRNPLMGLRSTNSHGQDQNCYYCTVAALFGTDTNDLVKHTETMMQDNASADEIVALFKSLGVQVVYESTNDAAALYGALSKMGNGEACGFAYTRQNGSGYMVVVQRDTGAYPFHTYPGLRVFDYQAKPVAVGSFPPEGGVNIILSYVFYRP
jgi:hypothetical protein